MTIRSLGNTAAVARLNSIRFTDPLEEVAVQLAEWEASRQSLVVPIRIELPKQAVPESGEPTEWTPEFFRDRSRFVRQTIATNLCLDEKAASRLTFTMTYRDAWYLGPRPNLDWVGMQEAVRATPEKFIELMLKRELLEEAAFDSSQIFVIGGFGPGVYLGSLGKPSTRRLSLAEAEFSLQKRHKQLLCDVTSKVFLKKSKAVSYAPSAATLPIDPGEGSVLGITRIVPGDYFETDARRNPLTGISLDTAKFRQTRLYYINVLTEFAHRLFVKAGVEIQSDTFVATHCVDGGYIPLEPLAQLVRPLVVVNTTKESLTDEALKPLARFSEFFPDGYTVSKGKRARFATPQVQGLSDPPRSLDTSLNYLFLNGAPEEDGGGTVMLMKSTDSSRALKPSRASVAYAALAAGGATADPYTEAKFKYLLERDSVSMCTQGLDFGPSALARLKPGDREDEERALQEALKRCLVELSLKEALLGHKTIPTPTMPEELLQASLTLIVTRHILMRGRQKPKQLVACVDIELSEEGIRVTRVRRSPWSSDTLAAIDFIDEFPFLRVDRNGTIRDDQVWVLDRDTGERLTVWWGSIIPKIILNHSYSGIEAALSVQEQFLEDSRKAGRKGRFYSKSRSFNLLPYYMSLYLPEHQTSVESTGTRIVLQDRGVFVRMFVPPAGGIVGAGDSLSGMRDVMVSLPDGTTVESDILDRKLVQIYFHTLTNGVLVGGDNSKMSMLEKLARLALEN